MSGTKKWLSTFMLRPSPDNGMQSLIVDSRDILSHSPSFMRILGFLKNIRLQTKYLTPVQYKNFAQHVTLSPITASMTDSLKSSIPQTRPLPESEVDEPAHKKLRLDDRGKVADTDGGMEEPIVSTSQPTKNNGLEQRLKKKKQNKKRKEPPLPELCSAADVLYQEIRSILGGDVVDEIASEGGAFKSPYSWGDEIEVTIDRISAGGELMVSFMVKRLDITVYAFRFWNRFGFKG